MATNQNRLAVPVRPPLLRRSWLFVSGSDREEQERALLSGADAVVADLEEFTAHQDRIEARVTIANFMRKCRQQRVVGAVRVNRLTEDGLDDLIGVMHGAPVAVFLPHVESPEHIRELNQQIGKLEHAYQLQAGRTEIVPTIESARGLVALTSILAESDRIRCCLLAGEDLSTSLGAIRGEDSIELQHVRSRFLVECIAAGVTPIDLPYSYRNESAVLADLSWASRVGFKSKCVVSPAQIQIVNTLFTPSASDVSAAEDCVMQWQMALGNKQSPSVSPSDFYNARRLLGRHAEFSAWAAEANEDANGRMFQ
nr:aldolase/citrate lyase family protein [Herbaspirillum sp. B65]